MTSSLRLVIRELCGPVRDDPAIPPLHDEVHVWHWEPLRPAQEMAELWEVLSEDERQRAHKYHFPKHRDEFVVNRARLRSLLGVYLALSPDKLVFEYSAHGKPSAIGQERLRFNLSHTESRAALAIVHAREIGIDIERIRPQNDAGKIAERFFSERERQSLRPLSGEALEQAFFRCWTRKEAYIKARGEGLSIPLHQFDVSLSRDEPAALLSSRPDPEEARRWMLFDVPLGVGYAGAVAVSNL